MYVWSPLPRTLEATLRDSQSSKPRVRLSAVEDLVRWAEGEARVRCIQQLVTLLEQDPDLEVRAAAALGLADPTPHQPFRRHAQRPAQRLSQPHVQHARAGDGRRKTSSCNFNFR